MMMPVYEARGASAIQTIRISRDEAGRGWGQGVLLQPRDILFHPPWDSGEYST